VTRLRHLGPQKARSVPTRAAGRRGAKGHPGGAEKESAGACAWGRFVGVSRGPEGHSGQKAKAESGVRGRARGRLGVRGDSGTGLVGVRRAESGVQTCSAEARTRGTPVLRGGCGFDSPRDGVQTDQNRLRHPGTPVSRHPRGSPSVRRGLCARGTVRDADRRGMGARTTGVALTQQKGLRARTTEREQNSSAHTRVTDGRGF
jgi:hypothetical protein